MSRTLRGSDRPWCVLAVLCSGFFLIIMDTTMVNAAIPAMLGDLDAGLGEALWVVNSYVLACAVFLITAGRLGDRFGPKRMYLTGLLIFTVASGLCGVCDTAGQLTALRAVQGLGAALLTPQTSAFIAVLFPPERRGTAFGVWSGVIGLSAVAGPLAGGALVAVAGWEWIFLVNVPVGLVALVLAAVVVPDHRPRVRHRWDVTGTLLATCGLAALCYGLLEFRQPATGELTGSATALLPLGIGAALLLAFVVQQRTDHDEPLVPHALYGRGDFVRATAVGAGVYFAVTGTALPLLLYLQNVLGNTPLAAAQVTAPSAFTVGLVAVVVGRLSNGPRAKPLLVTGLLLYAAGLALTAACARPGMNAWQLLPAMLVADAGIGCTLAPAAKIALGGLAPAITASASGVLNTARQVGGVLGSAAVGALLRARLATELPTHAGAAAPELPAPLRPVFTDAFAHASGDGIARPPAPTGLDPAQADRFHALADTVFRHAFVDAWRTTLLLPIGVLLLCCLLSRKLSAGDGRQATSPRRGRHARRPRHRAAGRPRGCPCTTSP
ncbi:DHA2 family efflux MFS transporter permease subunit [Streptomyces piniterrae]|uniref:DHA2 family efflux MFS transporter permease subunit n=1 Tax=Streptomyces piniterrae TaxID=2571125 RepID=A0A4V5MM12_9ACTN|nr:DHA2 family efflux MFS transporter permease subunit [Streptomyces piniterrae]TJZ59228.1 DHA2 family efflux MFS transporter permease subunit [Streptomyces piniterrae]